MARIELDEIVQGLGLLGNVLSIPRQVEGSQIENEQQKALLKEAGYDDATIAKMAPQPRMRWLSAGQPGFGGAVLGGVGDVGSILSSVVGKPVKAPRMEMSDIAAMTTLRSKNAQAAAKKRLGEIILKPGSTNKDIAAAAIEAGDTNEALRLLRPSGGDRLPGSILSLRGFINSLPPDDPRRRAQQTLDDQLEADRQRREEDDRRIRERTPEHYDPAQTERMRHDEIMRARGVEAGQLGFKEGTDEYKYFMSTGRPPQAPRPKPEGDDLEKEIDAERRRRNAMVKDPRTRKDIPNEPPEVTARRNLEAKNKAKAAEKSGEPLPEPPKPPVKKPAPGSPEDVRQGVRAADVVGARVGGLFSGDTPTTTTGPPGSTTSTTEPGAALDADTIIGRFTMEDKPPDVQAAVSDAIGKGMSGWPLANWLASLQPSILAPPGP